LRMAARKKPGFNEELSRCEGYRVGTGGGWRKQAAANYLGPSRALPADCFSCGWIFGSEAPPSESALSGDPVVVIWAPGDLLR